MPFRSPSPTPWAVRLTILVAALGLVACEQSGTAANAPVETIDPYVLAEMHADFLTVAGGDAVTFKAGSTSLSPKARFRLERQALWLRDNPVPVRLRAEARRGDIRERRLAVRRAEAVQAYLVESGVEPAIFLGILVEPGTSAAIATILDPNGAGRPHSL